MVKSDQSVHIQQEMLQKNEELKLKKKKKKKKNKEHNNGNGCQDIAERKVDTETNAVEIDIGTHKRKSKKKRKLDSETTDENGNVANDQTVDKQSRESFTDETHSCKKKRKKDKKHKIKNGSVETERVGENIKDDACIDNADRHVDGEDIKNKKKKKHKNKVKHVSSEDDKFVNGTGHGDEKDGGVHNEIDSITLNAMIDIDSKNLKRKRQENCENNANTADQVTENVESVEETKTSKKKKKKKKKRTESSQNHKLDNLDNANIEHTKSKIIVDYKLSSDKDSEVEHTAEETTKSPSTGQWHTANFEDTERQNKFIRLLGGFKGGKEKDLPKGKFDLDANKDVKNEGSSKVPNMAMTKTQESLYKIALESQYEKAMDFNQNRGLGLGFQKPPKESKKFHIDIQKSKSITFDD